MKLVKRWLLRIVVLLVLGAIVNIAVAWGFALWIDAYPSAVRDTGFTAACWPAWYYTIYDTVGTTIVERTGHRELEPHFQPAPPTMVKLTRVPRWSIVNSSPSEEDRPYKSGWMNHVSGELDYVEHFEDARGWPFRSLVSTWDMPRGGDWNNDFQDVRWGFEIAPRRQFPNFFGRQWPGTPVPHPIPLKPIWPGFAINTIFYAVILWVLFAAPFVLRRNRRINRGLCPKCAYPVGEGPVCTECGTPTGTTAKESA